MKMIDNSVALISAALPRATRISDIGDGDAANNTTLDFGWSFRPYTFCLNIFGIPFYSKRPSSSSSADPIDRITNSTHNNDINNHYTNRCNGCFNRCDCLVLVPLAVAFYLMNVSCNVYDTIRLFKTTDGMRNRNGTSVRAWNQFINDFNFNYLTTGTHTGLLVAGAFGWRRLVQSLHRMEEHELFGDDDYRRFRRVFTIGVIVIFLV